MKIVTWMDSQGYLRSSLLRDEDSDPAQGIPNDPPNLDAISWEDVQRELHNRLVGDGLVTWQDVQRSQTGVVSAVLGVLKKRVIELYKLKEVKYDSKGGFE